MNASSQLLHKESGWTVWFDETGDQSGHNNKENHDSKDAASQHDFFDRVVKAGTCGSYESFRNVWRQLCDGCGEPPVNTNIRVFRDGLKPLWEDPANVDGGKFVICIGSKDGGIEKFLAMVSALMAGDLSDSNQLNGAVLSSRAWGHTLSLWHASARPGDRSAQMLESELRALVDEGAISFHVHRKTLNFRSAGSASSAFGPKTGQDNSKLSASARVAPRMSLRQRKSGVMPAKNTLGSEMARLEARWSANEAPAQAVVNAPNKIVQLVTPTYWSTTEIAAALGAAIIALGLVAMS